MKKTVSYLLCAAALLGLLTACGTDGGKTTPKPTASMIVTATPAPTSKATPEITVSPAASPAVSASPNVTTSPAANPTKKP